MARTRLGLTGIGVWPELLYPALWLAPLLLLLGLQQLLIGETLLTPLREGDWRPVLESALAALICGLCWELWNYGSLPKWHYSIPYLQRFHLFEMPLLGYALIWRHECSGVVPCPDASSAAAQEPPVTRCARRRARAGARAGVRFDRGIRFRNGRAAHSGGYVPTPGSGPIAMAFTGGPRMHWAGRLQ
jgi:hypothetical protein